MSKNDVVSQSKDILGGTPVFAGTRVPVQTLIDYLEAGDRIDDFLEDFPSVTREQAKRFLDRSEITPEMIEEAERRLQAYRERKIKSVPGGTGVSPVQ